MQGNLLAKALLGALFLSVLFNLACSFLYVRAVNETRGLQMQATLVNNRQTLTQALVNESLEYSKRNPAIDPILHAINAKPRPAGN